MVYLSGSDLNVSVWIDPGGIRSTAFSDGAAAYRYVPQHDDHYDHREFGILSKIGKNSLAFARLLVMIRPSLFGIKSPCTCTCATRGSFRSYSLDRAMTLERKKVSDHFMEISYNQWRGFPTTKTLPMDAFPRAFASRLYLLHRNM